ncbi:hypothetical protein [Piscirickettsia litoralis]|uniref:ABC-type transport auxiliary lipoprotein component domain-containing protein n=1 Tax=Piscirickettsia litoralis TaxID=1891921 RepID=A0ABX3A9A9_9GAMM|nr:hypothetical protein [Piscirickettsia litoralis]ODN42719.1 hypothetical protein BGC07_07025 [Piscirickettsia litoralis]
MVIKKNTLISISLASGTLLLSACTSLNTNSTNSQKLPYTLTAYNAQYAQSFNLNISSASQLPKGLAAIELRLAALTNQQGQRYYQCTSTLYLDKAIQFWWPLKREKSRSIPYQHASLKAFISNGSLTTNKHNQLVPLNFKSATILSFNQNYTPDLTQLTLLTPCSAYSTGKKAVTEIWLEKQGGLDLHLSKSPTPNLTDFYQFKLLQAINNYAKVIQHFSA